MPDKKFIVTPKLENREERTVTMTIRLERALQNRLDELANQTNRSRNELIGMALEFAIDNIEVRSTKDNTG
jgi:predicted transcriptional regulator